MSEIADARFGAVEAARAIQETRSWDAALRHRIEGLTWMMWGIVNGGMFLSYEFAAREHAPGWTWALLWIPWVIVGNAFSFVLWRTAALSQPNLLPPRSWRSYAGMILVFAVIFGLEVFVLHPASWVIPMFIVGGVWAVMGLLIPRMSPLGRRVSTGIGFATLFLALVLTFLSPSEPTGGVLASLALGLTGFLGGLYEATLG